MTIRPSTPPIMPRTSDFSASPQIVDRPKITSAVISAGPKASATRASTCTEISMMSKLRMPPMPAATVAVPMARLAWLFFANMWPSKTVAAADGVPGTPIRIAEIAPPVMPPI